jgi:hypothetical protein
MNFTCDKCESTFTRRDSYERHRNNKHPEDENSLHSLNAIDVRKHLHVKVIYTDILKRVASLEKIQASNVNFVTRASKERVT